MSSIPELSEPEASLLIYLFLKPNYPYAIAKDFKEAQFRIKSLWHPMKIYPVMESLAEKGLVIWKEGESEGRRMRIFYVNIEAISKIISNIVEKVAEKHQDFPSPLFAERGLLYLYDFLRATSPNWAENPVQVLKRFKKLDFFAFLLFIDILAKEMITVADLAQLLLGDNIVYIHEGYKGPVEPLIELEGKKRVKSYLFGESAENVDLEPYLRLAKEFIKFKMTKKIKPALLDFDVLKSKVEETFVRAIVGEEGDRPLLLGSKLLKSIKVKEEFKTPEEFEMALRERIAENFMDFRRERHPQRRNEQKEG